jgi:outer membrane protein OmpA-like peptidoglycan-associated protein/tetratricopeptide (TPR) repeat protein
MKKYGLLFLFLLPLTSSFAQSSEVKRADKLTAEFRFAEAAELYEKGIKADSSSLAVKEKLAMVYGLMGDYARAEAIYQEIVQDTLADSLNLFNYAQVLRRNGKYEAADAAYKRFAATAPSDSRAVLFENFASDVETLLQDFKMYALTNMDLNTDASEIAPNYFQHSLVFASNRDTGTSVTLVDFWTGKGYYDLYQQPRDSSPVSKITGKINGVFNEGPVSFSADGREAIFTRTNTKRAKDGNRKLGLYHADYDSVKKEWGNIQSLTINNTEYNVVHPSLSKDGNTLYFVSDMPGGVGETDIYKSIKADNVWGAPVNLGNKVNTVGREMFPFLADDSLLYFSTDTRVGLGGLDIYSAVLINNEWTNVTNPGVPLNSMADDFGYISYENGLQGYIASDRAGGKGSDDIYRFSKIDYANHLVIADGLTHAPVANAIVTVISDKGEDRIIRANEKGEFTVVLDPQRSHKIEVAKEGYAAYSTGWFNGPMDTIALQPLRADELARYTDSIAKLVDSLKALRVAKLLSATGNMGLKPMPQVQRDTDEAYVPTNLVFELSAIYFDLNSAKLNPLSEKQLNDLVEVMRNFPELAIEITAHTDARGSAESNLDLSVNRAEACVTYLLAKGVDTNRLTASGYGEQLIRNKCKDGIDCTEAEHAINRRIEFKVVKFE